MPQQVIASAIQSAWKLIRSGAIIIPFSWLVVFIIIPLAIVIKISLAELQISIPPYSSLWTIADESLRILLNFGNYLLIFADSLYYESYLQSLRIAFTSTILALLLGYPMAYAIANANPRIQGILLLLILLPSWTSFLIRIYAWISILKNNGLINNFLLWMGIIDEPMRILNTQIAVYIGIVYGYLPFMILPIYANLVRMDRSLIEAATDLGCRSWETFIRVTLPLSMGGIIAGCLLVLIPAVGEFVIPELLGGSGTQMIGKILWQEFFNNRDWPVAAALTVLMLLLLVIPIMIYHRFQSRALELE